ncbi:hypothetical protein [Streptomyces brasiliensis]|uniref:Uncharacterized protein n=1 Tax=Streptomyces brasiliensis TaxID=1954 RepID=A0A917K6U5_9ACTN|nr:hypothetical protein [Streptomyces brasiliensis]GGJ02143.1 hypothetical protein GCM10010121_010660 [Streptomyces brasiliensis]
MSSIALDAALADIDTVFNGFASPTETGCGRCHLPEETAYLRTPYTRVPADVLRMYVFEVPDHFDDHAAAMRRLLPQAAHAMADGTLDSVGWGAHGLVRVDWRAWPAQQGAAIDAFVKAWWREVLATPEPPYPVADVFETCAAVARTVTPFLDVWGRGPVADSHLVACADTWLYDLLSDYSPFAWWDNDGEDAGVAGLRAWLSGEGAARLRDLAEHDLALRAELLTVPYEERFDRLD